MTLQQRGIPVTDPPEQLRRGLDVREHEGHQSRRERPGRPYHPISIVPCEPHAFWMGIPCGCRNVQPPRTVCDRPERFGRVAVRAVMSRWSCSAPAMSALSRLAPLM